MPQKGKTKSEKLFERFCEENSIRHRRILETSVKTPDYEFFPGGTRVVVEVKQVEPNDEDRKFDAAMDAGQHPVGGYTPGQRTRKVIESAGPQLKASAGDSPGLIVAFNMVDRMRGIYLGQHDVLTGMYGFETVNISVPKDTAKKPRLESVTFGGKRKVTPVHNTTLSAFAVIYDVEPAALIVYHNRFAKNPLNPNLLRLPTVRHYKPADQGDLEWKEWAPA